MNDTSGATLRILVIGSIVTVALLTSLLIIHDFASGSGFRLRTLIAVLCIAYLGFTYKLYSRGFINRSSWMITGFYSFIMTIMLITWGINSPVGILSAAFTILLPGLLFGARPIIFVSAGVVTILAIVQSLHSLDVIRPNTSDLNVIATNWDMVTYIIVFTIFGLLSWVSASRASKTLSRALEAERRLREQRDTIRKELEEEFTKSRAYKLKELERMYEFALIGQDTTATIHELSNHLSILNMDIDDLTQQHENSAAITRAQESVDHINTMLKQVRLRLSTPLPEGAMFNLEDAIRLSIHDATRKVQLKETSIELVIDPDFPEIHTDGDSLSWSQVTTILATNALEACRSHPTPRVAITLSLSANTIIMTVSDNGKGIRKSNIVKLFKPTTSTKPNGMGIGLYVAQQIIETQFNGQIKYSYGPLVHVSDQNSDLKSHFIVSIPLRRSH